jgi:hypothetical protein
LARRRHLRSLKTQQHELATTTGQMMVVVQLLDGSVVGVENSVLARPTSKLAPVVSSAHLSHSWYNRQRTLVSLGLLAMLAVGVLIQTGAAGDVFQTITKELNLPGSQISTMSLQTAFQPIPLSASAEIVRVDSAARNQYATDYEYQVWSFSSCSGISLEEVMDSYGRHYIASDLLQEELNLGVWDISDGLIAGEPGMARTAAQFGFTASSNPPRTLSALIATANSGHPVIVGIPGHILVVKGGDANYVYLVDSAPENRTVMTHEQFMNVWDNFSVLITPNN